MSTLQEISKIIKQAENILILAHVSPDPDALGSSSAILLALTSIGLNAKLLLEQEPGYKIKNLMQNVPIHYELAKDEKFDLVLALDTSNKKRLACFNDNLLAQNGKIISIDHHISSDTSWADIAYVSPEHPAASSIVFNLLNEMQIRITSEMANLLFAGVMDDCGSFRFSNTNDIAFETALGLLNCGANPELVSNNLYYSKPPRILSLESMCLSDIKYFADGRGALIFLTREDLDNFGAKDGDTDVLPDICRSAAGVIVSVIVRPNSNGLWKISLRSKDKRVDVNQIAAKFGGGGHIQASAFVHQGDIGPVKEELKAEITRWVNLI